MGNFLLLEKWRNLSKGLINKMTEARKEQVINMKKIFKDSLQELASEFHYNSLEEDDSHEDNFRGCTNPICVNVKKSIRILVKELILEKETRE